MPYTMFCMKCAIYIWKYWHLVFEMFVCVCVFLISCTFIEYLTFELI